MTINTVEEAMKFMNLLKENPEKFRNDHSLQDFANLVNRTGAELMSRKGDDYVLTMLSLVQSIASTILILEGMNPALVVMLLDDESVDQYVALIMKLSVGLAALEEL